MSRRIVRSAAILAFAAAFVHAAPLAAQRVIPGLDAAGIDTTVKPGDNFYRYANGGWERRTEIPNDRSSFGSFNIAAKLADVHVKEIVHGAASAHAAAGSELRKIGDFYTSYLDTAAINARGAAPIRPLLDSIAAIADRTALARFIGAHLRADVDPINLGTLHTDNLFGFWVTQDFNQPAHYTAALIQGGIEMPDRSYYLDESPKMAEVRAAYRAHVARMLTLGGVATADAGQDSILAWQPSAITGISALVASEPLETWKSLLAYHAIEDRSGVLPSSFDREAFDFFGKTLSGAPEQATRDDRAVDATSYALGFAVGHQYVRHYFPASAKARAQKMVAGIVAAFQKRIDALDWMAPSTKAEAKAKLRTLRVSIGYPDHWPSYAAFHVARGDAYGNLDRWERFTYRQSVAKLHQPVDKGEWVMTPQMVNAVNLPAMNVLNFPAAILQPPFFEATRVDAMNYGGIGAVIGHEVSHSFDNLGAAFDSKGRMRNWWTASDFAHFQASTQALARQYDAYHPLPDVAINGQQTLSEDIADLAGVTAAYDAWKASLGGKPAPVVGGLTGDQQFFLSFGQIWRTKFREPALRRQLLTNAHAPGPWRALTVRNLDAWYAPFDVTAGETLYLAPADRVRIW